MRKLKVIEHVSMDGVMEIGTPNSNSDFPYGDWSAPYRSPEGLAKVMERYGEQFDLLIGRRTYDLWLGYWPTAQGPMANRINAATKYVATHRPESLTWGPVEAIGPDLVAGVRAIKEKDGPDIVLSGSSTLTSAVMEHGLADELVLLVNPVLLGKGKRLFAEGTPARSFAFESTTVSPTGIVVNSYKFVGSLKNMQ